MKEAHTSAYLLTYASLVAGAVLLAVWPWIAAAEPVSAARTGGFAVGAGLLPDGCGTPLDPTRNVVDGRGPEPRFFSVMDSWQSDRVADEARAREPGGGDARPPLHVVEAPADTAEP